MQRGFKLKEVQLAPGATDALMDALVHQAAMRAGHAPLGADHIEVDVPPGGVQFGATYAPRRLPSQGRGE